MVNDPKTARKKDMQRLRKRMDGNDNFMEGHQIKTIRTRTREIPPWTLNDAEVQKVVMRSFPDWRKNRRHTAGAGRWVRIIQLYYRMQMPIHMVAKEMEVTLGTAKNLLLHIRRVSQGRAANNSGPLNRPTGRPKKPKS
jgi:hypothetical protein